jgi:hypothetical protein
VNIEKNLFIIQEIPPTGKISYQSVKEKFNILQRQLFMYIKEIRKFYNSRSSRKINSYVIKLDLNWAFSAEKLNRQVLIFYTFLMQIASAKNFLPLTYIGRF